MILEVELAYLLIFYGLCELDCNEKSEISRALEDCGHVTRDGDTPLKI